MSAHVIDGSLKTASIAAGADTVTTRQHFVKVKNLGANVVSFSLAADPTGAFTAGAQSSINPAAATGPLDFAILQPNRVYNFHAATGATLCAFEEVWALPVGGF